MSGNSETSCSEPDLCLDDDTSDCFRSGSIGVANNDKILTQIYRIGPFFADKYDDDDMMCGQPA